MKRFFDCLASGVGLVVLSPVLLGIAIIVIVRDGSPALFIQDRVGKRGRIFRCIKFRTMRVGTPEQATHEVGTDPITPVGKVLRRTKLDELPQLWNVFTGDMSLVGPRPCLPKQTELIEARNARGLDEIAPGITGRSQVRGIDMSDPVKLAISDARYLDQRGMVSDFVILAQTFGLIKPTD